MVSGPIEQNIFGKGGVYECLHIQKKSLSLKEYKDKMGVFDKITDGLTPDQVEDMVPSFLFKFWKNIVFSPPLYGADLLSTLMDEKAGPWNLSALDSILKYSINSNVRGVTTPYCYVGSWKTLFCWHKEDLDLSAINYVHEGKSKFWYSIPVDQAAILER
jgi:jumonji domain-containing protein 2